MITYNYLQLYSLLLMAFGGGALFGAITLSHYMDQLKERKQ
jgi:hypothetical protein